MYLAAVWLVPSAFLSHVRYKNILGDRTVGTRQCEIADEYREHVHKSSGSWMTSTPQKKVPDQRFVWTTATPVTSVVPSSHAISATGGATCDEKDSRYESKLVQIHQDEAAPRVCVRVEVIYSRSLSVILSACDFLGYCYPIKGCGYPYICKECPQYRSEGTHIGTYGISHTKALHTRKLCCSTWRTRIF